MAPLVLTAGLPRMDRYYTYGNVYREDETAAPGPYEFLPALLEELTGLRVTPVDHFSDEPHPPDAVAWVTEGRESR